MQHTIIFYTIPAPYGFSMLITYAIHKGTNRIAVCSHHYEGSDRDEVIFHLIENINDNEKHKGRCELELSRDARILHETLKSNFGKVKTNVINLLGPDKMQDDRFLISQDILELFKRQVRDLKKEKYMWESKEKLRNKIVELEEELQYFKSMAESLRCAGNSTADKLEQENVILRGKLEAAKKEIEIIRKDNALLRQEREMLRGVHDRKKENEMLKKDNEALKEGSAKLARAMTKDIDKSIIKENISLKQKFSALEDLHRATLESHSNVSGNCHKEIKRLKKKVNRLVSKLNDERCTQIIYSTSAAEEMAEEMRDDLAVEKQEVGTYKILLERATKERDSVIKTIHSLHEGHLKEIKHYEEMRAEYQECWNELKRWHFNCSNGKLKDNHGNSYLLGHHFKPSSKFIKE